MDRWAWDQFEYIAARRGDHVAIRQGDAASSFAELAEAAARLASALNIDPGTRVVVSTENSIATAKALLAIWHCGGTPVLVNANAPQLHFDHAITKTDAVLAIVDGNKTSDTCRSMQLGELLAQAEALEPAQPATLDGASHGSIIFTSGSTGLPKGVAQRASTLIDGAQRVGRLMHYTPDDVIACPVPFSFDYGWGQFLSMALLGVSLVLPEQPTGFALCAALERHRPTVLASVPSILADLFFGLSPIADTDCSSVRLITNTGSKIPQGVFEALPEHFPGADISLNYGLTETYRSTSLPIELSREASGSIGLPIEGVTLLVLREDGSEADTGEVGEFHHFGAGVFDCYWDEPEKTAATKIHRDIAGQGSVVGVRTGDFGYRAENGLLYLKGRKDRLVKCMGIRISLAEIEDAIHATGLVKEAAVTAADHDVFGSFITAHIVQDEKVPADDSKALVKQLRKVLRSCLSNYMQPREYKVLEALPRTTSGKVDLVTLNAQPGAPF